MQSGKKTDLKYVHYNLEYAVTPLFYASQKRV
jgi:hypothetical protein